MSASVSSWRTRDDDVVLTYLSFLEKPVKTATPGHFRDSDRIPCRRTVFALEKMLIVFSTPAAGAVMSINFIVYAGVEFLAGVAGLFSCCRFSTRMTCAMKEKIAAVGLS